MGRIKTKRIKRVTHDLINFYGDEFSNDYLKNRELVEHYANISSKKLRNTIAGYVTRKIRNQID